MIKTLLRHLLVFPMLAVLFIVACSRVTPVNYEKVHTGMTREEVYSILGRPDEVRGGGIGDLTISSETWKGRKNVLHVTFGGDTVEVKSISQLNAAGQH